MKPSDSHPSSLSPLARVSTWLATCLLISIWTPEVMAADSFANAEAVTKNVMVSASNADATSEAGEPDGVGQRTLWFRYKATGNGIVRVMTPGSSNAIGIYHALSVFRGDSLDKLNLVDSANLFLDGQETNSPNPGSIKVEFPAAAGMEFRICIASHWQSDSANMRFTVSQLAWPYGSAPVTAPAMPAGMSPANDDFANAQKIAGNTGTALVLGYNQWAGEEPGDSEKNGFKGLWYTYTATKRCVIRFATRSKPDLGFDHRLVVYRGSTLSGLKLVGSRSLFEDGVETNSPNPKGVIVEVPAEKGMEFKVLIACDHYDETGGPVVFDVSQLDRPLPEITVLGPSGEKLADGVSKIKFSASPVGKRSAVKTITIKNTGTADLIDLQIVKKGTNGADFTIGKLKSKSLAPGKTMEVSITFKPKAKGNRSGSLQIKSNDTDENPFDIVLTGKGLPKKRSLPTSQQPTPFLSINL